MAKKLGNGEHECAHCHRPFGPLTNDQRFCSPFCRVEGKAFEARVARAFWTAAGKPMPELAHVDLASWGDTAWTEMFSNR